MSSEGSVMSVTSRVRELGLYRGMEARTEDFLRLSKRRQLRQGCVCAALSTALTVTLVIVIIIIYEYTIADWTTRDTKVASDPIADRLDRSYFGLDQDYYERMPLLVNALQENSYVDPTQEAIPASKKSKQVHNNSQKAPRTYIQNSVRRTSPRPFLFEYRNPTPLPYSKMYSSRSWIEKYRNAQRLQNIRQIIKYLEKTINAKSGDMYTKPAAPIAFTGVYMDHGSNEHHPQTNKDLIAEDTSIIETKKNNHQSDPLVNYKPENPGEVNMLADAFFRFSPTPFKKSADSINKTPTFGKSFSRKIYYNRKPQNNGFTKPTSETFNTNMSSTTTKSFSVMLNLFPLKTNTGSHAKDNTDKTLSNLDNLYITTSRPSYQFKRKPVVPMRRTFIRRKPRILNKYGDFHTNLTNNQNISNRIRSNINFNSKVNSGTNIILHVNVSPKTAETTDKSVTASTAQSTTQGTNQPMPIITVTPITLLTHQVEDSHVGSSGIVPEPEKTATTQPMPKVTNTIPFIDPTEPPSTDPWWTGPTELFRFGHEDAKVPEPYIELRKLTTENTSIMNRRNDKENFQGRSLTRDVEEETVTIPIKTDDETSMVSESTTARGDDLTTPGWTYVPLINGHYRNTKQSEVSRDQPVPAPAPAPAPSADEHRKRRLQETVTRLRHHTAVPYVEIQRNRTTTPDTED